MTRKKARNKQAGALLGNEHLLALFNSSETEFKNYFKRHVKTTQAKEFYFLVLTKLKEALLVNETNTFNKLFSLVHCVGSLDPKIHDYFHEPENPLNDTNLVILSCKYNRPEILKFLLNCELSVLNILSSGEPEFIDNEKHNAFYYAIRAGNVELLDTLINKWPNEYFASNPEKLDDILSKAYAELKLKNVLLSDEVEIFVEGKLLDLRFYANISPEIKSSQNNFNMINDRINLVTENIDLLRTNYSDKQKVDDRFVFVAKFIAQNIHILKRQLKSTYDKLPWEEMEFCLICFVSSHIKQESINLFYKSTLHKVKILTYLENFAKKLSDEIDFINCNVYKLTDLSNLPKQTDREQIVAEITKKCPEFQDMYNDYQKLRDVCSLEKICDYLKLALSADPQERQGQLIIIRVMQVIGEYLKNTLESPKLSDATSECLLLSLSPDTKQIFKELRNALSHSYSLSKRMEFEDNASLTFFSGVQNDMKKIESLVINILYRGKVENILAMLESITEVKSSDEIETSVEIFSNMVWNEIIPKKGEIKVHGRFEKLMELLSNIIFDKTDFEKELFKQINEIINSILDQSKNLQKKCEFGLSELQYTVADLLSGRICKSIIGHLKQSVDEISQSLNKDIEPQYKKKIFELLNEVYFRANFRERHLLMDELVSLNFESLEIAESINDLKKIGKLRQKITGKSSIPIQKHRTSEIPENKYKRQLELKQDELQRILSNNGFFSSGRKNLAAYRKNKKLQSVVEMLVLDIMSILITSTNLSEDNYFFLDVDFPLLMGKNLRNHLAHDNTLIDLLPLDPAAAIVLNAQKLISANKVLKKNKKTGKLVENSPSACNDKYNREFLIISNQDLMFSSLAEGDLSKFKNCLQNGADIYARSINLRTSAHFASMASNLDVIEYIHDLDVNFDVQDIGGQNPLHVAAELGTQLMIEFLIEVAGLPVDNVDNTGKTALHLAAKNGHTEVVKTLLKHNASALIGDLCHYIPVHDAIRHNRLDVVKILIKGDFDINEIIHGYSPLYIATESGHLELVELLIQNKADVNVKLWKNEAPLHLAAINGYEEVLIALLKNGADVNIQTCDGWTALHLAILNGYERITSILLQHGARVNISVKTYDATPLHVAVSISNEQIKALSRSEANSNSSEHEGATFSAKTLFAEESRQRVVADLLKHGVDIHAKDENSFTSLHHAATSGYRKISELLIRHGAKVNAKTFDGATPLHFAALEGHKEVVDFLIINKADINAQTIKGDRPLHFAAAEGRIEVIDTLIKNKVEINVKNNHGETPLFFAARNGYKDAVIYLIKNKAIVNTASAYGYTPLCEAILKGHKDVVEVLIDSKAQINITSKMPIFLAVKAGHKDIVELLIAHGADINTIDDDSSLLFSAINLNKKEIVEVLLSKGADANEDEGEPLVKAVFAGFNDIVEILLEYKACTNFKRTNNSTLLHLAAHSGHKKIVNILVDKGMEVDARTDDNITPLYTACKEGHEDIVEILIENQADVNVMCDGETPLHVAARSGWDQVVEVLLTKRANMNIKDRKNRIPIEVAVSHGHLEVVKILLQHEVGIINELYGDGWTLLHIASQENHLEIVKYLVNEGSDINAKNVFGFKPVHSAALKGGTNIVEFFISKGISINDLGSNEGTILHYAAASSCLDVVKYLLANGATINSKDANGWTSLHIAASNGSEAIVKVLLEHGAAYNSVDKLNKKPVHVSEDKNVINLLESVEKLFSAVKHQSLTGIRSSLKEGAFVDAKNADFATPLHHAAWKGNVEVMNILLENGANPNSVCKKGSTPVHYAAKFSHFKAVLALLGSGAIYNAVSDSGKTPLDLTSDKRVHSLLRLINESFEKVRNRNCRIIYDLILLKDIETVKAILKASNKENNTLLVAAMRCGLPRIEDLKMIFQSNVDNDIIRAFDIARQGNYHVSLSILGSVFGKRKEIFGLNSPATLEIKGKIVEVFTMQGKFQESLNILEDICKKQTRSLGMYHGDTLKTKSLMAQVLNDLGKKEEALSIYREVYPKQKELLGPNHLYTIMTQMNLAFALDNLKKYKEALNLLQEAYERLKSNYGELHLATMKAHQGIAMILKVQKKFEEALKILRNVLEKKKMVFGSKHPESMQTLSSIASILFEQKKYGDALSTFQKVFDFEKTCLGSTHPGTLRTQVNMGNVYLSQGKRQEMMKIYTEIFEPVREVFGSEDPVFLNMSHNMEQFNLTSQMSMGSSGLKYLQRLQKDFNTAASNGDVRTVEYLIKNGFNVNFKDIDGRSPLYYASSEGHTEIVDLLLKAGADPSQITKKSQTLILTALSRLAAAERSHPMLAELEESEDSQENFSKAAEYISSFFC